MLKGFELGAKLILIAPHALEIGPLGQDHAPQFVVFTPQVV